MPECEFNLNLLHIFRTPFLKSTSGQLLLEIPNESFFLTFLAEKRFSK